MAISKSSIPNPPGERVFETLGLAHEVPVDFARVRSTIEELSRERTKISTTPQRAGRR